jgi:hypothetical protein
MHNYFSLIVRFIFFSFCAKGVVDNYMINIWMKDCELIHFGRSPKCWFVGMCMHEWHSLYNVE